MKLSFAGISILNLEHVKLINLFSVKSSIDDKLPCVYKDVGNGREGK